MEMSNELANLKGDLQTANYARTRPQSGSVLTTLPRTNGLNANRAEGIARSNPQSIRNEVERGQPINTRKRENNLILYNVIECEDQDLNARIRWDEEIVADIADFLDVRNIEILKVRRLGKKREDPNVSRPMLVVLGNKKQKWAILGKGKILKAFYPYGQLKT